MRRILFTTFLVTVLGLPGLGAFACLVTGSCGCHEAQAGEADEAGTEGNTADADEKKPCCPKARAAAAQTAKEESAQDESRTGLQAEHHECCCSVDAPSDILQAQNEFRVQVDSSRDFSAPAAPTVETWPAASGDAPAHRHFVPATGPPPQQHPQIHVLNCVWRA